MTYFNLQINETDSKAVTQILASFFYRILIILMYIRHTCQTKASLLASSSTFNFSFLFIKPQETVKSFLYIDSLLYKIHEHAPISTRLFFTQILFNHLFNVKLCKLLRLTDIRNQQ